MELGSTNPQEPTPRDSVFLKRKWMENENDSAKHTTRKRRFTIDAGLTEAVAKTSGDGLGPRAEHPNDGDATGPRGKQRDAERGCRRERYPFYGEACGSFICTSSCLGLWIIANLGIVPGLPQFDPSFVVLAMAASVEAIFLSTFILISQNRMTAASEKRAELDLQINLLTEPRSYKARRPGIWYRPSLNRMSVKTEVDSAVNEFKEDVAPEAALGRNRGVKPVTV